MNDFRLALISGKNTAESQHQDYVDAYHFWRNTWTDTFKNLSVHSPVFSDAFTRQDSIGAIFFKGQCIASTFFRKVDLSHIASQHDSYFSNWPHETIEKLTAEGSQIIVCSYFSIHPDFRRMQIGLSMKDLLLGFVVKYLLESDAVALCGTPRTDKAMNLACTRWGASTLNEQVDSGYGVNIDLVGFFKSRITPNELPILYRQIEAQWGNMFPDFVAIRKAA